MNNSDYEGAIRFDAGSDADYAAELDAARDADFQTLDEVTCDPWEETAFPGVPLVDFEAEIDTELIRRIGDLRPVEKLDYLNKNKKTLIDFTWWFELLAFKVHPDVVKDSKRLPCVDTWARLRFISESIALWADHKGISGAEAITNFSARAMLYRALYVDKFESKRAIEPWEFYEWRLFAEDFLTRIRNLLELELAATGEMIQDLALHPTVRKITKYIDENPGTVGKIIASEVRISHQHLRRLFSTKLRPLGYRNDGGNSGYFPPDDV